MLQKLAPEIGAIGLNFMPDSGASFSCHTRLLTVNQSINHQFISLHSTEAHATVRLCRIKEKCLKTELKCVNGWSSSLTTSEVVHQHEKLALESGVKVMAPISGAGFWSVYQGLNTWQARTHFPNYPDHFQIPDFFLDLSRRLSLLVNETLWLMIWPAEVVGHKWWC